MFTSVSIAVLLLQLSSIVFAQFNFTKREVVTDPVTQTQQDCYEQCKQQGKSNNCEKHCTVLTHMERHVTPPLDADCVKECQGGEVTQENPLKPECEEKCLFKEPSPVKRDMANTQQMSNTPSAGAGGAGSEEPGCHSECQPSEDGRGRKCTTTCAGRMPGTGRVSGPLNKTCVDECNGGPVTKLEDLKPECEQQCAFKGPVQVYQRKMEFGSKEACLQYCQQKGLGQSEQECSEKCHHTFSGMVQQQPPSSNGAQ